MNIKVNLRVVRVVLTLGLLSTGLLTRAADYRAPQAGNFVVKDFQFKSSEKLAMPLASQPIEIAGRNRMMRRMILDAIRNASDGTMANTRSNRMAWKRRWVWSLLLGSSPLQMQKDEPTRDKADAFVENYISTHAKTSDANDMLY